MNGFLKGTLTSVGILAGSSLATYGVITVAKNTLGVSQNSAPPSAPSVVPQTTQPQTRPPAIDTHLARGFYTNGGNELDVSMVTFRPYPTIFRLAKDSCFRVTRDVAMQGQVQIYLKTDAHHSVMAFVPESSIKPLNTTSAANCRAVEARPSLQHQPN